MTHISTCLQRLLLDYRNKGWLDVDTLIEFLEHQQVRDHPTPAHNFSAWSPKEKFTHKIVALMELASASEIEQQKLLQNSFTIPQLEELQQLWLEKVRQKLGIQQNDIQKNEKNIWCDYSKYRNGVHNFGVRTPCDT